RLSAPATPQRTARAANSTTTTLFPSGESADASADDNNVTGNFNSLYVQASNTVAEASAGGNTLDGTGNDFNVVASGLTSDANAKDSRSQASTPLTSEARTTPSAAASA